MSVVSEKQCSGTCLRSQPDDPRHGRESVGRYLSELVATNRITPADGDLTFMQYWTYFMLAWWLSWAAFVGVFLARISRGRTIREFVVGVLVVPSSVFFAWFTAISLDLAGTTPIAAAAAADVNSAFFATLAALPLTTVTSIVTVVLVVLFFVSGADANTYVLSMLTTGGSERPPARILGLWGVLTGAAAMTLLAAGGLEALQQMVIVGSAPFLLIVLGVAVAFWRDLSREPFLAPGPTSDPGRDADAVVRENGARSADREPVSVSAADAP
jgi:choline-glycine betaine transporter